LGGFPPVLPNLKEEKPGGQTSCLKLRGTLAQFESREGVSEGGIGERSEGVFGHAGKLHDLKTRRDGRGGERAKGNELWGKPGPLWKGRIGLLGGVETIRRTVPGTKKKEIGQERT